jgi:8-oxo-dGTP diphosphatase
MTDGLPAKHYAINVIEDRQGRLLFLRRAGHLRLGAGLWGFCAGRLEPGETAGACSIREMREEIGADHQVQLVCSLPPVKDSFFGGGMTIYLFHYRWIGGVIHLNREHTEWAWLGRKEFSSYPVMDGIDEDIDLLGIWPREYLRTDRLPKPAPQQAIRRFKGALRWNGDLDDMRKNK